jgi:hypothetical protein
MQGNVFDSCMHFFFARTDMGWVAHSTTWWSRRTGLNQVAVVSAFRDRGVLGPTSEMSLRDPVQMGRREAEREGGRKVAGDGRERGGNPAAFVFVPRPGRVRLQ